MGEHFNLRANEKPDPKQHQSFCSSRRHEQAKVVPLLPGLNAWPAIKSRFDLFTTTHWALRQSAEGLQPLPTVKDASFSTAPVLAGSYVLGDHAVAKQGFTHRQVPLPTFILPLDNSQLSRFVHKYPNLPLCTGWAKLRLFIADQGEGVAGQGGECHRSADLRAFCG